MKPLLALFAAMGFVTPAISQPAKQPAESCLRVHTNFSLVVHASYASTAPLFGPIGERVWAGPHWNPVFIFPQPANDVQGTVFTVSHGPLNAVWVNTLFDVDARHFQYVYFLPELLVTVIDVRFRPLDPHTTGVDVEYTRTALTSEGNEHVATMDKNDKRAGKEWQLAIDQYLAEHPAHSEAGNKP